MNLTIAISVISLAVGMGAAIGVMITAFYDRRRAIEDDPISIESRVAVLETNGKGVSDRLARMETNIDWLKNSNTEILREIRDGKEK